MWHVNLWVSLFLLIPGIEFMMSRLPGRCLHHWTKSPARVSVFFHSTLWWTKPSIYLQMPWVYGLHCSFKSSNFDSALALALALWTYGPPTPAFLAHHEPHIIPAFQRTFFDKYINCIWRRKTRQNLKIPPRIFVSSSDHRHILQWEWSCFHSIHT